MPLDILRAGTQVTEMARDMAAHAQRLHGVFPFATMIFGEWDNRLQEAIAYLEGLEQGGIWPFALPLETLLFRKDAPIEPETYAIVSVDGSQIEADSHDLVPCFLINVGYAALEYGSTPNAHLSSHPFVYYQEESLQQGVDSDHTSRGSVIGSLRTVVELEHLADLAEQWHTKPGLVAVADGSLLRWELGGKQTDPHRADLLQRYVGALARFRALKIPVCSYISRPNAREVANTLTLLALSSCDDTFHTCRHCRHAQEPLCRLLRIAPDRALFSSLRPGERSSLYRSLAPVLKHYHPEDQIVFCYVHTGKEVVRVEFPLWLARENSLDSLQALLVGQCRRGRGYPVVLMEAHEQAVIHRGGREAFRSLLTSALHAQGMPATMSQKRWSKNQRGV